MPSDSKIKVATWNVNSIKVRLPRLLAFLKAEAPDVVCLQELKGIDTAFPWEAVKEAGYEAAVFGQKTYNGVAVLSKGPIEIIHKGMPGIEDPQSRLLAVKTLGLNVICVYVPNGQEVGSEKYAYKLKWLENLHAYLTQHFSPQDKVVLTGDFNIAPEDRDVHNPKEWEGQILFSEPEKAALKKLMSWGFEDTLRKFHQEDGIYSWWDYRNLAFPMNRGLRIDFVLASTGLLPLCQGVSWLRDERKGTQPSDHIPVLAEFSL